MDQVRGALADIEMDVRSIAYPVDTLGSFAAIAMV